MDDLDELAAAARERPDTRVLRPASAGARLGASVADTLGFTLFSVVLGLVVALSAVVVPVLRTEVAAAAVSVGALLFCLGWTEIVQAASPGKGFVGIRIRAADGRAAPRRRLVWRWLVRYSFAILSEGLLVVVWMQQVGVRARLLSDANLEWVNFAIVGLRWAAAGSWLIVSLGCLGILLPARRALHDYVAGTAVFEEMELVRKSPPAARGFAVGGNAAELAAGDAAWPILSDLDEPAEPEDADGR